jgi:predicted RNA-binding Zn-ribbon protein involved in translation (DUF1610 family)
VESLSDLEWSNRLRGVLTADDAVVDETYRRRSYSQRACPECSAQTLARVPLPGHLRFLRKVGVDFRHYLCDTCGHDMILRHRGR